MRILGTLTAVAVLTAFGSAQCSLSTLFANNNSGNVGGGIYFDLTVNSPSGVTIVALDSNFLSSQGTTGTLDVYTTPTTFVGNLQNPGAWTLIGSAPVTAAGAGNPTRATYTTPIVLPQGTMGVALHANGLAHTYTNGNGANQTYTNNDLVIQAGSAQNTLFSGTIFNPRVWNGVIHYLGGCASAVPYGTGCGSTPPASFYELFDGGNPNDLPNTGITLNWTGQFYVITQGAQPIVTPTGPPTPFMDDDTQQIPLPWSYPTQQGSTSSVWVCSNGFVALEPTTITDWTESVGELLGGPMRFCPYWDDLNPANGGAINLEQDPSNTSLFHITWTGVPEFSNTGANDFQLTLHQAGTAEFKWGAMTATDGLVGYSPGNGAPDPGGTDISMITAVPLGSGRDDLALVAVSRPVIGTTAATRTENIPLGSNTGFLVYGLQQVTPGIPVPILGSGCLQLVSLDVPFFFAPTGATATHNVTIPNNASLAGATLNQQSAVFDPGRGVIITANAVAWIADLQ